MPLFRPYFLGLVVLLGMGCSNVRMALSDTDKRLEVTEKSKSAYLRTESGKIFTLRNSLITDAHAYLGTPYRYGSTDPKKGFDCSGLVYTVAKQNKLELPRSSKLMAGDAPHMAWKKADTGDLVFFGDHGKIHHVGFVQKNNGKELIIIHSTNQLGVISENVLASAYWKKRILFAVDITSYEKLKVKS